MPSATLLGQSILSGLFIGGLYGLMGLGLSLSWGYLRLINLTHFALVFLGGYLTYQWTGTYGINPFVAMLLIMPCFFLLGLAMQWLFARFNVDEFASLLVTFGLTIIIESGIQWIWTADFRKLEYEPASASVKVGAIYIPLMEALLLIVAAALSFATWAWLRFTFMGKAMRASAENPDIAAAFGIQHKRLALLLSGVSAAFAGVAGTFVALVSTLTPQQMYAWIGVVFAVVILGKLGSPLGVLVAGIAIGVSEAIAMAFTAPSWAPLVSFTLLILILVLRPSRI
ncbi:MAG: branched-chain amino acid ABC transporter permease [Alphaproteobacteria bacterium]